MNITSVGIRDAKLNLSKYIKMVKDGKDIIITDRGRPVGKIVPIEHEELPLNARIHQMEDQGIIEKITPERMKKIPPPIPVLSGIAQKLLQEDRNGNA